MEKILIVLEGFRRDTPIRDLCRREGIKPSTYYAWLKDFMEAYLEPKEVEKIAKVIIFFRSRKES